MEAGGAIGHDASANGPMTTRCHDIDPQDVGLRR